MKLITSPHLNAAIATLEETRKRLRAIRARDEKAPGAPATATQGDGAEGPASGYRETKPCGQSHSVLPAGTGTDRQAGAATGAAERKESGHHDAASSTGRSMPEGQS